MNLFHQERIDDIQIHDHLSHDTNGGRNDCIKLGQRESEAGSYPHKLIFFIGNESVTSGFMSICLMIIMEVGTFVLSLDGGNLKLDHVLINESFL